MAIYLRIFLNKYIFYVFFLVFFLIYTAAFSQEDPQSNSVYIINSFSFNITGITRTDALIRKGELYTGAEITGLSGLEKYINDKTQLLYNERVLESVKIDYTIGQPDEEGKIPVDVVISVKDTWNIIAIPHPKYSSNTGFDLTLKARDYNFLGTMSPLRIDLGYSHNKNDKNSFLFIFDSNIPFTAYWLNWNLKFYNGFIYRPDTEQPFYNGNITGLSVEFPISYTTLTAGINESFILNEENEDVYKPEYGNFQDGFYMSTNPYLSWKIPLGVYVGDFGEVIFTPGVSAEIPHEFQKWPLDDIRKGPSLIFKQNIGFNRVDWIGNFRKGLDVSIDNSIDYNFYKAKKGATPWKDNLVFSGIGHFKFNDFLGLSTNLKYRQWTYYDYGYTQAGDVLRGIIDKDIFADYMLSLNIDVPVKVFKFLPSVWFDNPKMRIFNFELFTAPFVDIAVYNDPAHDADFNLKNTVTSGGFEVIVFPEYFRSLFLRLSVGWNLRYKPNSDNMEIYIGTDLFY